MLADADTAFAPALMRRLRQEGHQVEHVPSGEDAELRLMEGPPDLLLLDIAIEGPPGIELCRRLRQREETRRLPVIMLGASTGESDRLRGFASGADDFIVKPCSMDELLARVGALLRRANPDMAADCLRVGDLELDPHGRVARLGGREIALSATEFRLVETLMRSPGRIFTRAQLLDSVWAGKLDVEERTVDVHVGRLRKQLTAGGAPDPIRTARGWGYGLKSHAPARPTVRQAPRLPSGMGSAWTGQAAAE